MNFDLTKIILEYLDKYKLIGILIIIFLILQNVGFLGLDFQSLSESSKILINGLLFLGGMLALFYTQITAFINKVDEKLDTKSEQNDSIEFLKLTINTQENVIGKISDNISEIYTMLIDINNSVKGVPHKDILKKIFECRTHTLASEIIRSNEFLIWTDNNIPASLYEKESKFVTSNNKFIFNSYIKDLEKISNNTLTNDFKNTLNQILPDFIVKINSLIVSPNETQENKVNSIFLIVSDLNEEIMKNFEDNMTITPLSIDLTNINNDAEEEPNETEKEQDGSL